MISEDDIVDKIINLSRSIRDICLEYPDVVEIMRALGFQDITKPGMLNTAGRFMTISKGAAIKGINLDIIRTAFIEKGFVIEEK